MISYNRDALQTLQFQDQKIFSFVETASLNSDTQTVNSFGDEWEKFDTFEEQELKTAGDQYFDIVTPNMLGANCEALDIGCGSGRWSRYLAPHVKHIEAIDPSEAVKTAAAFTKDCRNVRVTQAGYGCIPFEKNSFDFVFSLGVVHHVPDTEGAIGEAAGMVKPGGHLLLYIYYSLDNRGVLYKLIFHASALLRRMVSAMPRGLKFFTCDVLAVLLYLPFVGLSRFFRFLSPKGNFWKKIPLAYYADKTWRIIRNDSLDRFGTPLEKRFSKKEIETMLQKSGMRNIRFSEQAPYWHVIAQK
mgnify:CR=1 FL=1